MKDNKFILFLNDKSLFIINPKTLYATSRKWDVFKSIKNIYNKVQFPGFKIQLFYVETKQNVLLHIK